MFVHSLPSGKVPAIFKLPKPKLPPWTFPATLERRQAFGSFQYRGLSIDSRAYVISQLARRPIRTPRPTCANQNAWVAITPKRPKANSIHTAAWHNWTRMPARNIIQKTVFSLIHLPASFICLWPSCYFDLGRSRHGWGDKAITKIKNVKVPRLDYYS